MPPLSTYEVGVADGRLESRARIRELEAEVERLKTEGSPGVMHAVDQAFHNLAIKERDYERVRVDRLQAEVDALSRALDQAGRHDRS